MSLLSERFLADAGGWQVMQQARSLHGAGRVLQADYVPPLLQGRVREGQTEFRAGLKILSKSNVENLCSCRASRQRGVICEHSIAVGLAVLKPLPAAVTSSPAVKAPEPPPAQKPGEFSLDGEGALVECQVILAKNLASGWQRDSITIGIEAILGGRRVMFNTLKGKGPYRCEPPDFKLIQKLQVLADGELPGMLMLSREQFLSLLEALAGHPRVSLGKETTLLVEREALRLPLSVKSGAGGVVTLKLSIPAEAESLFGQRSFWLLRGTRLSQIAPGLPAGYQELLQREIVIPAEAASQFVARELPVLAQFFAVDSDQLGPISTPVPVPVLSATVKFCLHLEGSLNHLVGSLEAVRNGTRGEHRVTLGGNGYRGGDLDEERALGRLRQAGFAGPDAKGQFTLKGEPAILAFFARELPRLEREWTVNIGARFEHVTKNVERIEPRLEIRSSGENWFELNFELVGGSGERYSASEIQRLLQSGRSSLRKPNGKVAVFDPAMLDEFEQVLKDCNPQQRQPGQYRIGSQHAAYLEGVAQQSHLAIQSSPEWKQSASAPRELDRLRPVPLGDLESVLRPYQKQGVYWLNFLAKNHWGGILADEMGLGKTVQMLGFLRTLKGRALVVCPSSLVYNWQREAARFAPDLRTLVLQGPKRHELFSKIAEADLILTSYPLLRRDADRYRDLSFQAMVLDEAQHIKNPDSQNAQSAQSIKVAHRFVLTGTPVENSVRDLWSIMNFLMPGYLGSRTDFKERYEQPIQSSPGGAEQARLLKRLQPFILRRTKRLVAPELPEKIEQVAYCELTSKQIEVYTALLGATRKEVAGMGGKPQGRMLMLTALLRLRQACCDLRLLQLEGVEPGDASAKLELLEELIQQALDGGHRVLVFSQFVAMLDLIRERLKQSETRFCYLDGQTKDRQKVVDEFQTGEVPVFLISLKAGGVGLNLTAADTVIHFDPWWNPAVEAQATDRAHRIGQKNVVTAYKLIARNTVEEKILALQVRKRGLIDATVDSEQPLMDGLTSAEIESLILS